MPTRGFTNTSIPISIFLHLLGKLVELVVFKAMEAEALKAFLIQSLEAQGEK